LGLFVQEVQMKNRISYAKYLAILMVGVAGFMGWISPAGKDVYAQYYCTLTCGANVATTGKVGSAVAFTASANASYCIGSPEYNWDFGDGGNAASSNASHTYSKAGTYTWTVSVVVDDASASRSGTITISADVSTVSGVSAASYDGSALTSEAIVATFGSGLATATQVATSVPLPTTLAGTTVKVKDSTGTERLAPLFFVSPGQINHQIPPGTATGTATMTVTVGNTRGASGTAQIASVAPGLFSANSSGLGVASGYILRVRADNSQSIEPINQYDSAQSKFVAVPIDLGPPTDQVFLILFGTGIRFRSSLAGVSIKLGGVDAQVLFAGPQGDFVGLDQLNILVPRSLAARGDIDGVLIVDGKNANTIRVTIK
jgi:uncharacterized protein (TIGR03437 family)